MTKLKYSLLEMRYYIGGSKNSITFFILLLPPGGNKQSRHTEHPNSDQLRKIQPTLDHRRRLQHDYKIGGKKRRTDEVGL